MQLDTIKPSFMATPKNPEFPPGFEFPTTDIALDEIQSVMYERRWKPADLSRESGVSAATISHIFRRKSDKSKFWPALLAAADLPLELVIPGLTDGQRRMAIAVRDRAPEDVDAFLRFLGQAKDR